jgi:hypothetical protein
MPGAVNARVRKHCRAGRGSLFLFFRLSHLKCPIKIPFDFREFSTNLLTPVRFCLSPRPVRITVRSQKLFKKTRFSSLAQSLPYSRELCCNGQVFRPLARQKVLPLD